MTLAVRCQGLGVFVHWYAGQIDAERIRLRRGPLVSPTSFRDGDEELHEDEVVWFKSSGAA